jgi:hypothetical protein
MHVVMSFLALRVLTPLDIFWTRLTIVREKFYVKCEIAVG